MKTQHYDRLLVEELIKVDVLKALGQHNPDSIENYAIQMFYLANNHGFFTCSEASRIYDDLDPFGVERVKLVIEASIFVVNVRSGDINQLV